MLRLFLSLVVLCAMWAPRALTYDGHFTQAAESATQRVFWSGGRAAEDAARTFATGNRGVKKRQPKRRGCQACQRYKKDAQKSFSSQRSWCGMRLTIRTRQPNVPPLDQLFLGNLTPSTWDCHAKIVENRVSRATRSGYVIGAWQDEECHGKSNNRSWT